MNRYYVYVLKRPNGEPFYVGKGKGSRMLAHELKAKRGEISHRANVIRKIMSSGKEILKEKIACDLTHVDACSIEIAAIAKFGRRCDGGVLVNITTGGDGAPGYRHDLISLAKLRAKWDERQLLGVSQETREKMRRSMMGKKHTEETRNRLSVMGSGDRHWNYGKTISNEHAEKLHASIRRAVIINGDRYASLAEAGKALGIAANSVHYRINGDRKRKGWPGYRYE